MPEKMEDFSEMTGFPGPVMEPVQPLGGDGRPLSLAWISDELLARTQKVWSRAYGRPVSEEEAVEILRNVKQLAEVLLEAKRGGGKR